MNTKNKHIYKEKEIEMTMGKIYQIVFNVHKSLIIKAKSYFYDAI